MPVTIELQAKKAPWPAVVGLVTVGWLLSNMLLQYADHRAKFLDERRRSQGELLAAGAELVEQIVLARNAPAVSGPGGAAPTAQVTAARLRFLAVYWGTFIYFADGEVGRCARVLKDELEAAIDGTVDPADPRDLSKGLRRLLLSVAGTMRESDERKQTFRMVPGYDPDSRVHTCARGERR